MAFGLYTAVAILKTSNTISRIHLSGVQRSLLCHWMFDKIFEDSETLAVKVITAAGTQAWFVLPMGLLTCKEALAVRNLHLL
ncbi:hypothetical protein J6590_094328, partial [Homalodisca vitripennis]